MEQDLLLKSYLKRLRLPAVAQTYPKMAQEAARTNATYEQYLLNLLEQEVLQREANQQKRRLAQARFPVLRTLDSFDFSALPTLNKAKVLELGEALQCHPGRGCGHRKDPCGHQPGRLCLPPGQTSALLHRRGSDQ